MSITPLHRKQAEWEACVESWNTYDSHGQSPRNCKTAPRSRRGWPARARRHSSWNSSPRWFRRGNVPDSMARQLQPMISQIRSIVCRPPQPHLQTWLLAMRQIQYRRAISNDSDPHNTSSTESTLPMGAVSPQTLIGATASPDARLTRRLHAATCSSISVGAAHHDAGSESES